jgi:hypothetical protein
MRGRQALAAVTVALTLLAGCTTRTQRVEVRTVISPSPVPVIRTVTKRITPRACVVAVHALGHALGLMARAGQAWSHAADLAASRGADASLRTAAEAAILTHRARVASDAATPYGLACLESASSEPRPTPVPGPSSHAPSPPPPRPTITPSSSQPAATAGGDYVEVQAPPKTFCGPGNLVVGARVRSLSTGGFVKVVIYRLATGSVVFSVSTTDLGRGWTHWAYYPPAPGWYQVTYYANETQYRFRTRELDCIGD